MVINGQLCFKKKLSFTVKNGQLGGGGDTQSRGQTLRLLDRSGPKANSVKIAWEGDKTKSVRDRHCNY